MVLPLPRPHQRNIIRIRNWWTRNLIIIHSIFHYLVFILLFLWKNWIIDLNIFAKQYIPEANEKRKIDVTHDKLPNLDKLFLFFIYSHRLVSVLEKNTIKIRIIFGGQSFFLSPFVYVCIPIFTFLSSQKMTGLANFFLWNNRNTKEGRKFFGVSLLFKKFLTKNYLFQFPFMNVFPYILYRFHCMIALK